MKKLLCLLLIVGMCISLAACGKISSEKAISIALDDLGIDRVGAARTDAVLDDSVDPAVYDVKINRNSSTEHYLINAKTGEIISYETIPGQSGVS